MIEQVWRVRLPHIDMATVFCWLRDNEREGHYVGFKVTYPSTRGERGETEVLFSDRDTALMLKLALN